MHRLIFALSVSLVASVAFAAPPNDMAARTELHAIDTLTLSDAQFLTGDANARATVTTGVLRIPRGDGRLPVVVLQHGSGGMAANIEMWSRELNAIGVSTLALDGFTGRGLRASTPTRRCSADSTSCLTSTGRSTRSPNIHVSIRRGSR
jgi:predicted dienelactone hydrolase